MKHLSRKIRILIIVAAFLASVSFADAQANYKQEIEKWRAEHETDLKKDGGWLTVAGLFWLKDGANSVGAGSGFDVELPADFKGKFGVINFQNSAANLKVENGVQATSDGKNVSSIELVSDENGNPTVIKSGGLSFYLIKRENRFGIRLKNQNSPKRLNFTGLHWFPIDENYKVTATFEAFSEPKEVLIPNVLGGNFKMKSPGILKFEINGKNYSLQPVEEEDHLFIIFRDLSSKTETYGAGRFLYAEKPVNGKVILDFNKAENPPCAFTSFATCPLPPPQNRLNVSIKAGEKRFGDH